MLDPFYPVVPDVSWVKRLVPIGTRLIQLRLKDQPDDEIGRQVREAQGRLRRPRRPAHRQRLLADGDRRGLRLGPSRPGGPFGRRHQGAASRRHQDRRQHARSCRAGEGPRRRSRLCGARARSGRPQLKQMPWAPQGTRAAGRMEAADRQAAAGGDRRSHPRTRAAVPEVRRRHRRRGRRRRQPSRSRAARPRRGSPRRRRKP